MNKNECTKRSIAALVAPVNDSTDIYNGPFHNFLKDIARKVGREDHLVVIPTETVYGLAANALSPFAVGNIFKAKERPRSNPLICHVTGIEQAYELYKCSQQELIVIEALAARFWPGPLSICAQKKSCVPDETTANSKYVAVRCPDNKLTRELIKLCGVPLAAPSANKFGCISPTCVEHVLKYFETVVLDNCPYSQENLVIFDMGAASVGIESTVISVIEVDKCVEVKILRPGDINEIHLQNVLQSISSSVRWTLKNSEPHYIVIDPKGNTGQLSKEESTLSIQPISSPGMLLKHYSPKVLTYLVEVQYSPHCNSSFWTSCDSSNIPVQLPFQLCYCAFIDPIGQFPEIRNFVHAYISLMDGQSFPQLKFVSERPDESNIAQMQQKLFNGLYQAEAATCELKNSAVLIVDILTHLPNECLHTPFLALYDRLYRAASGVRYRLVLPDLNKEDALSYNKK